jgi:hypothetical protein
MKRFITGFFFAAALTALPVSAQAPPPSADEQQLVALVNEVIEQQGQIADNNTKIESKVAEITEAVRVARIFAGRTGK